MLNPGYGEDNYCILLRPPKHKEFEWAYWVDSNAYDKTKNYTIMSLL